VVTLENRFKQADNMHDFFAANKKQFKEALLNEAVNVRDKIEEIHMIGNINLVENAVELVHYVMEEDEDSVKTFAHQEGIAWAKQSLTLSFKLEWIQAIRRTLWNFLEQYDSMNDIERTSAEFYNMEKSNNDMIDQFLNSFFLSYSEYKDKLIEETKTLVDKLSVPIIPINSSVSIAPLTGTIDMYRASIIEEKILVGIGEQRIETLIMDLSGVAEIEQNAVGQFLKLIDGISMMGAKTVTTGIRPEIVHILIEAGIQFEGDTHPMANLQQALKAHVHYN